MNPLRLLLLAVLIYVIYRLFRGARNADSPKWDNGPDAIKHDILIEDPICHTYVPKSQAVSLEAGEKIYYFCSKRCRDIFCSEEEKDS